ncbi:MAG: endonuclease/exonuclease/phosphatase family protein, partial [Gammaproteobacteria bacterium]|nr:endonuclease/exonuclease/phosphatase family protein [Gammaproteobacteria bacterium]
ILVLIHLALGKRARVSQLDYISDIVNQFEHVIVMGDMNCKPGSPEMDRLFRKTKLREPLEELHTFPSWRPIRNIDHILVTPTLNVKEAHVLNHSISDHLPIAMEIELPKGVHILG